jgi:hypothetical protein
MIAASGRSLAGSGPCSPCCRRCPSECSEPRKSRKTRLFAASPFVASAITVNPAPYPPLLGAMPASCGASSTIAYYVTTPIKAQRLLVLEQVEYLSCREFRVPLPYRAYPNSRVSQIIEPPPHLFVRPTSLGNGRPTLVQ